MSPLQFGPPAKGWPDFGRGKTHGSTYIAGPMRGIWRFNYPAFDDAQKHLEAEGWQVFSPAQMDRETGHDVEFSDPSVVDAAFMQSAVRRDLQVMLKVDAIHLLEGWQDSKGANFELEVARGLGLEIYEQVDGGWVRRA